MINDQLKSIYKKQCPERMKKVIESVWSLLPDQIKYGNEYKRTLNFLKISNQWSEDRLIEYQIKKLKVLLKHAVSTVPFYQNLYHEWGVEIDKINDLDVLKEMPVVTKEIIQADPDNFLSSKFKKQQLSLATTGGSSGEPFKFFRLPSYNSIEWAFVTNLWNRVGFSNKYWRIVLRGLRIDNKRIKRGEFWEYKPKNKELVLSAFHMNEENMFKYFNLIKRSGFKFLHCHTSSGFTFANFLNSNNLICPLKAVLTASETIYPFQREIMEKVFNCRVYSLYGQSEQVCLAGECEENAKYHIQPEYGITEILNAEGKDVETENEIGEIVATGFINKATPFIRYRTGDYAAISNEKCTCGRNHRIINRIEGREYEYVITKNGTFVSVNSLIHGQHFDAFSKIRKMQLYQHHAGKIEIRIVKSQQFSKSDETEIRNGIQHCLGYDGLDISFEYPNHISLTSAGKHRMLIQELDLKF